MPTPRQYQFDVDTKRYLNRVNTYRALNGLPDIQKSDAADIDNFVIGLKDLGVWPKTTFWLLSQKYNTGSSQVLSLGGVIWDGVVTLGSSAQYSLSSMNFTTSVGNYPGISLNYNSDASIDFVEATICACISVESTTGAKQFSFININQNSNAQLGTYRFGMYIDTSNSRSPRLRSNYGTTKTNSTSEKFVDYNSNTSSIQNNTFYFHSAYINNTSTSTTANMAIERNGVTISPNITAPTAGTVLSRITNTNNLMSGDNSGGTMSYRGSFVLFCSAFIPLAGRQNIYNLYKQTIGKGLNLP